MRCAFTNGKKGQSQTAEIQRLNKNRLSQAALTRLKRWQSDEKGFGLGFLEEKKMMGFFFFSYVSDVHLFVL